MNGFLCSPRRYNFGGLDFEYGYCGPWPLCQDGELRKRAGRTFYDRIQPWLDMSEAEREKYRIGGGCVEVEFSAPAPILTDLPPTDHIAEANEMVRPCAGRKERDNES
ncbi:hypothetical protein HQ520_14595 [bacterium]|nr:hypothetical protein [bacterium]